MNRWLARSGWRHCRPIRRRRRFARRCGCKQCRWLRRLRHRCGCAGICRPDGSGGRGGLAGGVGFGDPACGDGLAQGGIVDSGTPGAGGDGAPFIKQALTLRGCSASTRPRLARRGADRMMGHLACRVACASAPTSAGRRPRSDGSGRGAHGRWPSGSPEPGSDWRCPRWSGKSSCRLREPGHLPVLGKSAKTELIRIAPSGIPGNKSCGMVRVGFRFRAAEGVVSPRLCTMPHPRGIAVCAKSFSDPPTKNQGSGAAGSGCLNIMSGASRSVVHGGVTLSVGALRRARFSWST